jgi:putative membrane-bound dehydrogenase-like protein
MLRRVTFLSFVMVASFSATAAEQSAVGSMKLPPGFRVRCVASEPTIRQPISMSFDDRGRMWVLQYIQYPIPAGLKPVKQDQYLRTIWNKIPEPPPKGDKGADKLTILSDPDENGVFRKSQDFLTGLNLASGFCLGNGGVYVLQSPYLLFYPDRNGDDVPDGDPEVLLTGFGFDDTHSVANSLQWGPDGWLYGAAGSTSTSKIKNPGYRKRPGGYGDPPEVVEFQQGIWRYHPPTKRFELFSEGGGNTFGLDFDATGQCLAGTNWGGFALLHHLQGAYYVKGFSKHGPLHNPHTYGYLEHVPYKNFQGGHVTCGGVVYEADLYPKEYHGQYIAANLLSNCINWHKLTPAGATFTAEHGGTLLSTADNTFRPIDCLLGPDGCIYVADWTDKRAAHLDPIDNWDKSNGRVYRIEYVGEKPGPLPFPRYDLRAQSDEQLIKLLEHPNLWWRKEARRLLAERTLSEDLRIGLIERLLTTPGPVSLELLWVIAQQKALSADLGTILAHHPNENVRAWMYRFFGDDGTIPGDFFWTFLSRRYDDDGKNPYMLGFQRESSARVHAQLLCTAKRLVGSDAVAVVEHVQKMAGLHRDVYQPNHGQEEIQNIKKGIMYDLEKLRPKNPLLEMLEWWAIEPAVAHGGYLPRVRKTGKTLTTYVYAEAELDSLDRKKIRRILQPDVPSAEAWLAPLVHPTIGLPKMVLEELLLAVKDGRVKKLPDELQPALAPERDSRPLAVEIRARLGEPTSRDLVLACLSNTPEEPAPFTPLQALQLLSEVREPRLLKTLLRHWPQTYPGVNRSDMLLALTRYDQPDVGDALLKSLAEEPAANRKPILNALLNRPTWAKSLWQAYDQGTISKTDLTLDHARLSMTHPDAAVLAIIEKHFGKLALETAGEKRARIAAINLNLSREKPGDPALGKVIFTQSCSACHQLHGEGQKIGPDLTTADRKNRTALLGSIVDPSGYIRPEYLSYTINTADGRSLQGMLSKQTDETITLVTYLNGKTEQLNLAKADIERMMPSAVSLMPEKLLDALSNEEIRHLFAYIQSDAPLPAPAQPVAKKLKVALISGSLEYKSAETLPILQKDLEAKLGIECVRIFRKTDSELLNLKELTGCDAAIFFTRRLTLDGADLKHIQDFVASGKPILGIRTASHGFQKWLDMDALVFGGDYKGHFGAGPKCTVTVTDEGKKHPITKDLPEFSSAGSLYKNPKVAGDVLVLQRGTAAGKGEPVTWVRERNVAGKTQRVFYTSLGHPDDFQDATFLALLRNATSWCLKLDSRK